MRSALVARFSRRHLCHWTKRMSNTNTQKIPIYLLSHVRPLSINRCIASDCSHSYFGSHLTGAIEKGRRHTNTSIRTNDVDLLSHHCEIIRLHAERCYFSLSHPVCQHGKNNESHDSQHHEYGVRIGYFTLAFEEFASRNRSGEILMRFELNFGADGGRCRNSFKWFYFVRLQTRTVV